MDLGFFFPFLTGIHGHNPQDHGLICIYNFGDLLSLKWPMHATILHLPLPQDHCMLLKLAIMTGLFLTLGKVENTFLTFLTCHKLKKYIFGYLIQERCATCTILFLLV